MNKLNAFADESVKGTKHKIYAKDNTSGHATAGAESAPSGGRKITVGIYPRFTVKHVHCQDCNVDMQQNEWTSHDKQDYQKLTARARVAEAERLSSQAQASRDRVGMQRAEAAARLIQAGFKGAIRT